MVTVTIIRFSLRHPFKNSCGRLKKKIKNTKNTNKRTIYYATKLLITIFCYDKGIVGKFLQHSTLLV